MLTLQVPPDALVTDGAVNTGFFTLPFRTVKMLEAPLLGGPGRLGKLRRRLRLKEWVGFGITHADLYGGILIQHAGYAASGAVYLYDRNRKEKHEWLVVDLPTRAVIPDTLWNSETRVRQGRDAMRFTHELEAGGRHTIQIECAERENRPGLQVSLVLEQDLATVEPLVVSLPIHPGHHTYTHKSPLRIAGHILIGGRRYQFDPARDLGNLDEQKTFYPYRSRWHWGSFAMYTDEGRQLMANFVDQMTPKGEPGEDAIWVDGKLEYIAAPEFRPDPTTRGAYRVEDPSGRVRVTFTPEGSKAEKRNYGLVAMDYEQFFGRYSGTIVDRDGHAHRVQDAFGALERMRARF